MNKADIGIVEKLKRQADQTSSIHREMAEAKSLRQESNTERRTDLYMWPTPEQTTEGQAAAIIMEMVEALENILDDSNQVAGRGKLNPVLSRICMLADATLTKVRGK